MSSILTLRQQELLQALRTFIRHHGYPPSQRQLAKALNCKHHSIQELLRQLEIKGYVSRDAGVTRGLRILPKDNERLAA